MDGEARTRKTSRKRRGVDKQTFTEAKGHGYETFMEAYEHDWARNIHTANNQVSRMQLEQTHFDLIKIKMKAET